MTTAVTVVVPVHGDAAVLRPLLEVLDRQAAAVALLLPVVICDDHSDVLVASQIDVKAFSHLELQIIRATRNGGPGAARNVAMGVVSSAWVAFLDADVVPVGGWLSRLLHLVAESDAVDVIEGRVFVPEGARSTPFSHATEIVPPAQRGAGNFVMRTDTFRSIGGFDERYFDPGRRLHFREDADLAFRLDASGARMGHDPELMVMHPALPPSFWVPLRLARRYYFDPLLSREHPSAFRSLMGQRRMGPMSLRRARHDVATAFAAGVGLVALGQLSNRPQVRRAGLVISVLAWAGNVAALCVGREVSARDVPPVAVASVMVPWIYLANYWRGVLHFRHRPRL